MSVVVVIGAQWGDEGKGKVVDLLTENAQVVSRYGGGANAGHTLVIDGQKLVTHLIPSGVMHPGTTCVLGSGMVIDPDTLLTEIAACKARGLLPDEDLVISERAHVILPFHKTIETLREARSNAIGTTKRGIGPAYEAKAARRGIRMRDLTRPERLSALIEQNLQELSPVIAHYGGRVPTGTDIQRILDDTARMGDALSRYITNAGMIVYHAVQNGRNVLFEGAQGTLLDLDNGTYPYVTSSTTVASGACHGVGIGPTAIDCVIGIAKAYLTRVGGGPFPTELHNDIGAALRARGHEFGATTGRPRRCGWLDVPALRMAVRVNGLSGLALTKLDVLTGLDHIQVCTAYELDGHIHTELPLDTIDIERARPIYQSFPGWKEDITDARTLNCLPDAARSYISAIENAVGIPCYTISVGPERMQTIRMRDPFDS